MKFSLLVMLGGISGSALASFDLMLVQEATPTGGLLRVHRVDPANGVSLGSFFIGPESRGMAASLARRELYTTDINGNLRTYDYSTGAFKSMRYIGMTNVYDFVLANDGNRLLYVNGSNTVRSFDLNTGSVSTLLTDGAASFVKVTQTPNGDLYLCQNEIGSLKRYMPSGPNYILMSTETYAGVQVGQMAFVPGTTGTNGILYYGSYNNGVGYNITSNGNFIFGNGWNYTPPGHANVTSVSRSHVGAYFAGLDTGGTLTRISEVDAEGYMIRTNTFSGINGGVKTIAIVLAPEPGSVLALGAGLAILLRRRKRR